jgi:hypothetical protein
MGVNLPLLSLYDLEGFDVRVEWQPFPVRMDRALASRFRRELTFRSVYIDFDDCVVLRDRVNPVALVFLHQCIERGIAVHLVTRCAGDLQGSLARHRLTGLFDSIVHLRTGEPKSGVIRDEGAIFIDDSFRERREVAANCGIPVFAAEAIDTLLI